MLTRSSSISGKTSSVTAWVAIAPLMMMKTIIRFAATGLRANQAIPSFMTVPFS